MILLAKTEYTIIFMRCSILDKEWHEEDKLKKMVIVVGNFKDFEVLSNLRSIILN
jgi:hypothetical protein